MNINIPFRNHYRPNGCAVYAKDDRQEMEMAADNA